jgi:hypothetical protein
MTTQKTATKRSSSRKTPKPRTIKVVGENGDESAVADTRDASQAKSHRKSKATPKEKRLSAISAAAKVLTEAGEPMNAKQLIEVIVAKGYWTSPAGKTPHATLYSAILTDDPDPIQPGQTGTVTSVSLHGRGKDAWHQIDVAWDNGRTLMLVLPPDEYEIVEAQKKSTL